MGFWKSEPMPHKSESFTLSAYPQHYNPKEPDSKFFSNRLFKQTTWEDSLVKSKGQVGEDVNAPLTPLMPNVKRNKDNHLSSFLEDKTKINVTRILIEGKPMVGRWKENNKTKDL